MSKVKIVQHGGVHVHELHRARRHVDRECRPHAGRQRRAAAASPPHGEVGRTESAHGPSF